MSTYMTVRAGSLAVIALALLVACADPGSPNLPAPVASVTVTPATGSVMVGEPVTLHATPRASDGQPLERTLTWASENETRATVSATGVVTTLAVGEVTITAASEGRVGQAVLTILPVPPAPVARVRLSVEDEIALEWDGSTQISAAALDAAGNILEHRTVEWSSSRPSVATVTNGAIRAVAPGTATVTAIVEGRQSSVDVRVNVAPVTEVVIEVPSTGLELGEVAVFGSRLKRASGEVLNGTATWTSSAPAVARVTHTDLWYATVEAVSEGVVTITATAESKSASLTLRVAPRPTYDLIYNRWSGSASEIFVLGLAVDGTAPLRLNAGNVSREPSASPDGTQFVFAVSQQNVQGQWQHDLYIVNRNGMNMRWLTRAPGLEDQPAWSPDGSRILFHGVDNDRPDLFVINVDGTGLTNVTAAMPGDVTDKRDPAWSPDGTRIAFIGARGGKHKVWTIDVGGTNATQVTTDDGFDMSPTWSPASDRIAFSRYDAAAPANGDDVMIVRAQGGTPTRLSLPGDQQRPAWSPDGRYIAVAGSAIAGRSPQEIYTLRPDGTGLKLRTVNPAWGGGSHPAWISRR